jgi:hypothetical protein
LKSSQWLPGAIVRPDVPGMVAVSSASMIETVAPARVGGLDEVGVGVVWGLGARPTAWRSGDAQFAGWSRTE